MKKPFARLIDLLVEIQEILPKPIIIQYGHTPIEQYKETIFLFKNFLNPDEYSQLITNSEICIGHCGAGFVLDCIGAYKRPIILARQSQLNEHIDNHQVEFYEYLINSNLGLELQTINSDNYRSVFDRVGIDIQENKSQVYIATIERILSATLK
jgi:UDP-N-acetylglucosamine transferase subunit ALG13